MREIELRRSIRKYKSKPVEMSIINSLIESARLAPSGSNTQPWHFIVITDDKIKNDVATVSHNQKWMLTAPVFIVCVADIASRIANSEDIELDETSPQFELKQIIRDTSIAIEHIVLNAITFDLGTCWVAWFTQKEIRSVLGIPGNKFVVSILTVGYPDENPNPRRRKDLKEIIHINKW